MFSPQERDCSRYGNTLSVPPHITELTWTKTFPLKRLVLVLSRPTSMVSGLKQQIMITKRYFVKSHLAKENAGSPVSSFFDLDVWLTFPQKERRWDSPAGFCC